MYWKFGIVDWIADCNAVQVMLSELPHAVVKALADRHVIRPAPAGRTWGIVPIGDRSQHNGALR